MSDPLLGLVDMDHALALGIITRAEHERAKAARVPLVGERCAACKGVAHEATGHRYSPRTLVCRACAERFFRWVQRHTRPRKGTDFYGAATRWPADRSRPGAGDASLVARADVSPAGVADACGRYLGDASPRGSRDA